MSIERLACSRHSARGCTYKIKYNMVLGGMGCTVCGKCQDKRSTECGGEVRKGPSIWTRLSRARDFLDQRFEGQGINGLANKLRKSEF